MILDSANSISSSCSITLCLKWKEIISNVIFPSIPIGGKMGNCSYGKNTIFKTPDMGEATTTEIFSTPSGHGIQISYS